MKASTIEDYCRLIDKLDSGDGVRSREIARGLGLSKNTVALTLQKLAGAGFVGMKRYGKARLSRKGVAIAKRMNFKHRVLETFLFKKLGMSSRRVHDEANALEHLASEDMIARLYRFMGKPRTDPHGKTIR